MRLLEHESKSLLRDAGLDVPTGFLAATPDEAGEAARRIGGEVVLKPQIPAGGRAKAGGLAFAFGAGEAAAAAARLFAHPLRGYPVGAIWVEERIDVRQELFVSMAYDSQAKCAVLLASASGGVDVESQTGAVLRYPVSFTRAWPAFRSREVAGELGLTGRSLTGMADVVTRLVRGFVEWDALLVEINPLVLDGRGRYVALDAHIELDDDALYRHADLVARFEPAGRGERPLTEFERQAKAIDGADHRGVAGRVVEFDGDLGLLIGGGGASLTAFDAILDAGLKPANYCEIGGNPSVWKVQELTRLLLSQPRVKSVAVICNVVSNTRVDLVARGVIKGIVLSGADPSRTVVAFRMPGSWEDEGFQILSRYGVPFYTRETSIDQVVARIAGQCRGGPV